MKAKKPKPEPVDERAEVDAYMARLQHPLKAEMEAVRTIIREANSKLIERVKWNAPSFFYKKDMLAFNPRAQEFVQLVFVFYDGAMIQEPTGLLEGDYKDRRLAKFHSLDDIRTKKAALEAVVNAWVKLMDK